MNSELFDVIIVGAGLSGLAAARFFLDVHPESCVLILEKEQSVGGPWGRSRIYPGFWSQSGIRMSGFSDVPLTVPQDAEVFNDIFEAKYVTDYLENYLDNHVYSGTPLRERVRTGFVVSKVDKLHDIWTVNGALLADGVQQSFKTKRIIIATGMTSAPKMPKFKGQDQFGGPILHQKDYGQFLSARPSDHGKVAVLGAGKSAADMVYGLVKAGNEVHWIIRKSGKGPGAFTNPAENAKGPFLNDPELAATRLFGTMSPSCFNQPNLWTRFLHTTSMGEKILKGVWNGADEKCKRIGNFHGRQGALEGFDQLESDVNLFWCTGPFGMIQRPDFWDIVAENVHVHRNDIESLAHHAVVLKDGPPLPMDVIVCATGFVNEYPFFSVEQRVTLGLSHPKSDDAGEDEWSALEAEADNEVLALYPKLALAPNQDPSDPPTSKTPNRLYNCITPLYDHSVAFVGNIYAPNGFRTAEVQAIWTTALFDESLQLPSEDAMRKDVAWVNAFMKRRYPTHGAGGNYLQYDMMGYIDRLLRQVGLTSHLKGWWTNLTFPMIAKDLGGTTKEYIEKYAAKRKASESE
ncbi:hypothetical protein HBH53_180650 [Parastagonospora nodorum]|nr:hypothetical protein HBH53_180650 [Parastagonospora nodorum]KAH4051062.1 hypothetical protein HBH49_127270 [Parastagonospora nodorum]KAH4159749.1 hypothetical protein HBH43_183660 [Parastagonospora nodorum]KAH4187785.1 hypothetical protein HBH42_150000 [Parastagonospora nodorum]KAH4405806.1 hypothetical protein HBH92_179830 [Parastagonospora nodorum]